METQQLQTVEATESSLVQVGKKYLAKRSGSTQALKEFLKHALTDKKNNKGTGWIAMGDATAVLYGSAIASNISKLRGSIARHRLTILHEGDILMTKRRKKLDGIGFVGEITDLKLYNRDDEQDREYITGYFDALESSQEVSAERLQEMRIKAGMTEPNNENEAHDIPFEEEA